MRKNTYILPSENTDNPPPKTFETAIKKAVLLALLEEKSITQWEYDQGLKLLENPICPKKHP